MLLLPYVSIFCSDVFAISVYLFSYNTMLASRDLTSKQLSQLQSKCALNTFNGVVVEGK